MGAAAWISLLGMLGGGGGGPAPVRRRSDRGADAGGGKRQKLYPLGYKPPWMLDKLYAELSQISAADKPRHGLRRIEKRIDAAEDGTRLVAILADESRRIAERFELAEGERGFLETLLDDAERLLAGRNAEMRTREIARNFVLDMERVRAFNEARLARIRQDDDAFLAALLPQL